MGSQEHIGRSPKVSVRNVAFAYPGTGLVLESLSLTAEHGTISAVMGPSGCGKTTFLRLVSGSLAPRSGSLTVNADRIAFLYQKDGLLPWYTVGKNVALAKILAGADAPSAMEGALKALDSVGLASAIQRFPHELSEGMKKRVELARILASDADVWLLDEPFESLDPTSRLSMTSLVLAHRREQQATVLMVTHGFDDALLLADWIYVLTSSGNLLQSICIESSHPRDVTSSQFQHLRRQLFAGLSPNPDPTGRKAS